MHLTEKISMRERDADGKPFPPAELCFQNLVQPSVLQIAFSSRHEHGPAVNYIDTAIREAAMVADLQELLAARAERVLEPFPLVLNDEEYIKSPLLGLDSLGPRAYAAIHQNSGKDWRLTVATADAAAASQFYNNRIYQFSPELGFFGRNAKSIENDLVVEYGDDSEIVRGVRRLVELAVAVLNKKIVGPDEEAALNELAVLVRSIGEPARAVIADLENKAGG